MKSEDIIDLARKRMTEVVEADQENREDALNDLEFLAGRQWPDEVKEERGNRPMPTINRLPRFVRQVTGDIRKLNPAVKVMPADENATEDTAETFAGLIRQIEQESDASSVYEGAAESAAQCGIGNFRILAEYERETSFNQKLTVQRIHNPLAVYWDPAARKSTRADADYCFITDQISQDAFKEEYPNASPVDAEHDGTTDGLENWHDSGEVVIAEYMWKEREAITLGLLPDGSVVESPTAAHYAVKTRKAERTKVMWAKISGKEVLEGPTELPCRYIPVVAVTGEEIHVGDKVMRNSVIRFAKPSAQIYNYYSAAEIETVALQPKAPWLLTVKQISGQETYWNRANDDNLPYLVYTPDEKAPPPQRQQPPVASQGILEGMARAEDDMKATTGIFDAAMGNQSNEQSGVAIRQRQLESDISTSIYTDNLSKAIEQAGRIMVSMIPKIYDTQRVLRILGDDDQERAVMVNGQQTVVMNGEIMAMPVNPLTEGEYDVRVTVGPNYTTRRQETAESMMQFVQSFPAAGEVAGDLIAKAMDWPDADKLAERLEKILPPGMVSPEDMPPEQQEQIQQQMMQAQQQEQMAMQAAQAAQEIEMRKAAAEAAEAEADAQKAQFEAQKAQMEVAAMNGQINDQIAALVQQEVARITQPI